MICADEILDGSLCNVEITNLDGTFCDVSALYDGDEILVNYYNRIGYTFDYWKDENGDVLNLVEIDSDEEGKHSFKATARCGGSFIAVFTPIKCRIQTLANINEAGTQEGGGYYDYGSQATIKATTNNGYYFEGWYYNNQLVSTSYEFTLDVSDSSSYTAIYSLRSYIVNVTPNDKNLGSVTGSGEYTYMSSCTITATPLVGSYFVSWSDGDTNTTRTFNVTSDVTFQAIFKAYSYTITVNKNIEACYADGSGEYAFNSIAALTARPANGYVFDHWETSENPMVSTNYYYTTTVTRNMTYTAIFRAVGYKLNVFTEPIDGGVVNNVTPYIIEVPPDSPITLVPTPSAGYTYSQWSDNAQNLPSTGTRTIIVQRDTTLTCYFSAPKYTLTIYVTPEGYGNINGYSTFIQEFSAGESVTVTVHGLNYYTLDQWSDGSTDTTRTFTMLSDITLYVTMKPIIASVTLSASGDETCLVEGVSQYTNTEFPIHTPVPITLSMGPSWYFDSIGNVPNLVRFTLVSGNTYDLVVSGDMSTKIYFAKRFATIAASAEPSNGGTVNGVASYSESVTVGSIVTLSAVAANGYIFSGWSDGNTNATRNVTVNQDIQLTAQFTEESEPVHLILVATRANTTINGETLHYEADVMPNTDIPLTIVTEEGYYVVGLERQDDPSVVTFTHVSGNQYTIRIYDDYVNEINIGIVDPVNVTISVRADDPDNAGYVQTAYDGRADNNGTLTLARNHQYSLTAVANSGYEFNSWNGVSNENPKTFSFSADSTLIVSFDNI